MAASAPAHAGSSSFAAGSAGMEGAAPPLAILDSTGTLVDTHYHHAPARWYRAFRHQGVTQSLCRIHQRMGMSEDQLVADRAGDDVEHELGDDIRGTEDRSAVQSGAAVVFQSLEELVRQIEETPLAK